jgi:hypothetical protein
MNPLKSVLTFTFAVFFTIGLLANQNLDSAPQINDQITIEETSKVSAVKAISLFNFFKVETVEQEESISNVEVSESKLKEFFDYFIMLSHPIP